MSSKPHLGLRFAIPGGLIMWFIIVVLLAKCAMAQAADEDAPQPRKPTPVTEWIFDAAETADMLTTLDIKNQKNVNGTWRLQEDNPILGPHPSQGRIIAICVATGALHYAITRELVNEDVPKPIINAWEYISIGVETAAAAHNYSIGLRFKF